MNHPTTHIRMTEQQVWDDTDFAGYELFHGKVLQALMEDVTRVLAHKTSFTYNRIKTVLLLVLPKKSHCRYMRQGSSGGRMRIRYVDDQVSL